MEARDYCQNTSLGQKHIARRATDRCCDVATYTSYTSRTHKSNTSRTQVVHKSYIDVVYNNVAYTMGSVLRPLLDVLQHVGFLLAQYDFDNMQCFRYSKPSRILVIQKQIDFKTSVTKIPLLPVLSAAVRKVWAGNRKFVSWASISQLDLNGFFAKRDEGWWPVWLSLWPAQWRTALTTMYLLPNSCSSTHMTGRRFKRRQIYLWWKVFKYHLNI